jgi:chromosomal replication initiation ATPase DnaA
MPRLEQYLPAAARGHMPRIAFIMKTVAEAYLVDEAAIRGRGRRFRSALARHIVWHATRAITGWSYPELGDFFQVDQSSARHGDARIAGLRKELPDLNVFVEDVIRRAYELG